MSKSAEREKALSFTADAEVEAIRVAVARIGKAADDFRAKWGGSSRPASPQRPEPSLDELLERAHEELQI